MASNLKRTGPWRIYLPALSFGNVDSNKVFDLVFGIGTSLGTSAITEGVLRNNTIGEKTMNNTLPLWEQQGKQKQSIIQNYPTGKGSCGLAVFFCKA